MLVDCNARDVSHQTVLDSGWDNELSGGQEMVQSEFHPIWNRTAVPPGIEPRISNFPNVILQIHLLFFYPHPNRTHNRCTFEIFKSQLTNSPQISPSPHTMLSLTNHLAQLSVSGSRAFSTTSACATRSFKHVTRRKAFNQDLYLNPRNQPAVGDKKSDFKVVIPNRKSKYPPYPYGESFVFKRGDRALFGGRTLGNGYRSSEFRNKTLRKWKPNAQKTTLPSEALGKNVRITTVPRVLSTIRREGGLDAYLTKDTPLRIKEIGVFGWNLRHKILSARNYYQDKEFQPVQTPQGVWKHSWGMVKLDGKQGDLIAKKATLADHLYAVQCYQQMKEGHQPMARGFFNQKTAGWSAVKFFNSLRDAKVDVSEYVLFGGVLRNKNSAVDMFKQARQTGQTLSK